MSGWMPGTRWETLPKSVPAAIVSGTTPVGSGSRPRARWERTQAAVSGPLVRTGISLVYSGVMISTPVPVISAAPRSRSSTRPTRSLRVSGYFERTKIFNSLRAGMTLGTRPPSTTTA